MSISGGTVSTSFTYDPNGNQTSGLGRSISYTSYNKPASITQGSSTLFFSDDTDHQRFKQVAPEGTTLYFSAFGVHTELFIAATSQWYDFIGSGGSMVGVRVLHADNSVTTRHFQKDNLGSVAVVTDENGNVVERDSYDAWGKRRFPNGADDPSGSLTSQTTAGFTGQEQLTDVGLVHLNGRVYDPLVGRMMSADPLVPDPMNGQAWNRYSYVINNPLALTDTNGYCFLSLCSLFKRMPILGNLFEIAAVALCNVIAPGAGLACAAPAAALSSGFVAGVTSGSLSAAIQAGVMAFDTAVAFYAVAEFTGHRPNPFTEPDKYLENVAGHALVGCASAAASGGKCGPAALAGAATSAAAPFINGKNFALNVASNTVLGGLAAVAGGGKFANGAITSAFGYLFNYDLATKAQADAWANGQYFQYAQMGPNDALGLMLKWSSVLSLFLVAPEIGVAEEGAVLAARIGGPVYVIGKFEDLAAAKDLPGATFFVPSSKDWFSIEANIENSVWILQGARNEVTFYTATPPIPNVTLTAMFGWEYNEVMYTWNYWRSGRFLFPSSVKP